ncbi:MAG: STAS domain-containing protein [Termitinemataceae bacterium]
MKQKDTSIVIEWSGSLGLPQAVMLHQELIQAFKNNERITLDISKLEAADTSVIQLLCAALCESRKQNKEFLISGHIQNQLQKLLQIYGFMRNPVSTGAELATYWCNPIE